MATRRRVSVLYAPGTNTEIETMEALRLAGGDPYLVFLKDIIKGKVRITDCSCFVVPGGFSYGDYPDTGVAVAELLREHLTLLADSGIPIIGICNGMQTLIRAGVFFGSGLAMAENESGDFVSRPVLHRVEDADCVWTRGLEGRVLVFPAAHRFGKLEGTGRVNVVMTYEGASPSGSKVAAICDDTGRVMAMMDHPERPPDSEQGLAIFRNGLTA
ncbi:MAG: phosphoribosylformylglycinamidine synthase subunit PurQ [Candidatus Moranbacteria bacterium]|nr:phosphoribosylformylglycinamidine synthase subunit PurQ [Candidatus Moranbacteria bacterium]